MRTREQQRSIVEPLEQRQLLSGEPWGLCPRIIGQDKAVEAFPNLTGAGYSIAVIDSGVDYNHPALGGGWGRKVVGGYDFISNDSDPFCDTFGHGTGTAGVLAADPYVYNGQRFQGIAPGAKIIALRQNSQNGVTQALKWVVANRTRYNIVAVDMVDWITSPYPEPYSGELQTLWDAGVFIAQPMNNSHDTNVQYPVLDARVFGVGGINTSDQVWYNSQLGAATDILGPAQHVTLPYYDPGTRQHIYTSYADGNSWATPHVVGAATLIKQISPAFTPTQIMSILRDSGQSRWDSMTGRSYPRLDLHAALQLAYQRAGTTPPTTPPPTTTGRSPYGSAFAVGATIEAEAFDRGGEGVAYHDTDSSNLGGAFRQEGVDIEGTRDSNGGYNVGWTRSGEWLLYSVSIGSAGSYKLDARVASPASGAAFDVTFDGQTLASSVSVPNTGGWQNWATISSGAMTLSAGTHVLGIRMSRTASNGFAGNFNWFRLSAAGSTGGVTSGGTTSGSTPFNGVPINLPGLIEAENYDRGGEGVGYHDVDGGNLGGGYRSDGVDIGGSSDVGGGYSVGWIKAGEWLQYTVNLASAATYTFDARVAALGAGGTFRVEIDGVDRTSPISIPNTGGWQIWRTISTAGISLSAGEHKVRLVMLGNGSSGYVGNFNWIRFR